MDSVTPAMNVVYTSGNNCITNICRTARRGPGVVESQKMLHCQLWGKIFLSAFKAYLTKLYTGLNLSIPCRTGAPLTCPIGDDVHGSNPIVAFISKASVMYNLERLHRLWILPLVPVSTNSSTLYGTVKWVSTFGLSNTEWLQWVQTIAG